MSRKPKNGPVILAIESLSNGRTIHSNKPIISDFNGAIIEPARDPRPARELPGAQEIIDTRNKAKRASALQMLQRVGLVGTVGAVGVGASSVGVGSAPTVPTIAGKRVIAVIGGKALYAPSKPFRRI